MKGVWWTACSQWDNTTWSDFHSGLSSVCACVCVVCKTFTLHFDVYVKHTLHSHMVQESFFHRSPSARSRPSLSVQSVLLRRVSSLLICEDTRTLAFIHTSHCYGYTNINPSLSLATNCTIHKPTTIEYTWECSHCMSKILTLEVRDYTIMNNITSIPYYKDNNSSPSKHRLLL